MDMRVQISVSLSNKYTIGGTYNNTHLFLCECKLAFLEKNTLALFKARLGKSPKTYLKQTIVLFYRGYSIKGP
jgi:hypothetical protein